MPLWCRHAAACVSDYEAASRGVSEKGPHRGCFAGHRSPRVAPGGQLREVATHGDAVDIGEIPDATAIAEVEELTQIPPIRSDRVG